MRDSWRSLLRRLAATSFVFTSVAWSSAMCYAAQLAFDSASDPVYADGWQGITHDAAGNQLTAGDNGGFGFTAWNFDSSYFWPGDGNWYPYTDASFHAIDDGAKGGTHYSNPFNNIGKSWALGVSETNNGPPRAGRGFDPLEIGQTLKVVFDNPTDRKFFKGYFIRLSSTFDTDTNGDAINGNTCNGAGANCTPNGTPPAAKMYLSRFEYFDDGEWGVVDADNPGPPVSDFTPTGVFDTDTAAAGALFQVTRTGEDTYDVLLDPFGPKPSYTLSETFDNPGTPVNWIEFTFFNTLTDTGTPPSIETDFYVRSIEIIDAAPAGVPGDYNDNDVVDAADFTVWRDHLGANFQLTNEVEGITPGSVTTEDYNEWKSRFGDGLGATLGSGSLAAAVPEACTLIYVSIAAGASLLTRRCA